MLGVVRTVDSDGPSTGIVKVVELVSYLGAGIDSEFAGGAGNGAALWRNKGERVTALEIIAVDGERLVAVQRRHRVRRDTADARRKLFAKFYREPFF